MVDAIIEKLGHSRRNSYMRKRNSTGLTPLLLALSIFSLTSSKSEELRTIQLLLKHGDNANDQDTTDEDTSLHRVVRDLKNSVVLELLCRENANPNIKNKRGDSPMSIVLRARRMDATDEWALFALRRMKDELQPEHYRPQELTNFLSRESREAKSVAPRTLVDLSRDDHAYKINSIPPRPSRPASDALPNH